MSSPEQGEVKHRLVLLTGPSGAGRSTAIKALEDAGFETIDNLPIGLLGRLLSSQRLQGSMALGLDVRNRDFSPKALLDALDLMDAIPGAVSELVYLDCRADVLRRRYNETRRQHPMAPNEDPSEGIARELAVLESVRARADVLMDTSDLSPHELRATMAQRFALLKGQDLALTVESFSYKRGLPQTADLMFDCRFLRNPHWQQELRDLDGGDGAVGDYVGQDPSFAPFIDQLMNMTALLLPAYVAEGRSHLMIGFGCTGGQHRSVFVAETVAAALAHRGWQVSIRHRELNRFATLAGRKPGTKNDGEH